jgi:hypothetical protein
VRGDDASLASVDVGSGAIHELANAGERRLQRDGRENDCDDLALHVFGYGWMPGISAKTKMLGALP